MAVFIACLLIVAGLIALQVKHWVPFDFSKLRGNHPGAPKSTVFDPSIAREDGSIVSSTRMAKVCAVIMGLGVVALLATIVMHPI